MEPFNEVVPSQFNVTTQNRPPWLNILLMDAEAEAQVMSVLGARSLGKQSRVLIWKMCNYFDCDVSVGSVCCRIWEQYMARIISTGGTYLADSEDGSHKMPRAVLTVICCFQLAAKNQSQITTADAKGIHVFISQFGGNTYTIPDIQIEEIQIFKHIGMCIPLYSSAEMTTMLVAHLGLPPFMTTVVIEIVSFAEVKRLDIDFKMKSIAEPHTTSKVNSRVRTLHLAASCVCVAVYLVDKELLDTSTERLAQLLDIPVLYLSSLQNIVLICTLHDDSKLQSVTSTEKTNESSDAKASGGPEPGRSA